MAEQIQSENETGKSAAQLDSEHFSPYRADGKLYGFICVVTGATQPIGKAIVAELAAHGAACIYACAPLPISSSPSTDLADAVNAAYPNTKIIEYPYNPASEEDTLALIDDVLNTWGRLDVWTCSSALPTPRDITSTGPGDLIVAFEGNAMPVFFALKYAPAAMHKRSPLGTYPNAAPKPLPYGSIIVVTHSTHTYAYQSHGPGYTMASHAALGVVRSGVAVLKGTGVRINAICAGDIDGDDNADKDADEDKDAAKDKDRRCRSGLERAGKPEEVARAVGFLASGFSSYITGAEIRVDGGMGVMGV